MRKFPLGYRSYPDASLVIFAIFREGAERAARIFRKLRHDSALTQSLCPVSGPETS